jgi:hypothetical protein
MIITPETQGCNQSGNNLQPAAPLARWSTIFGHSEHSHMRFAALLNKAVRIQAHEIRATLTLGLGLSLASVALVGAGIAALWALVGIYLGSVFARMK